MTKEQQDKLISVALKYKELREYIKVLKDCVDDTALSLEEQQAVIDDLVSIVKN